MAGSKQGGITVEDRFETHDKAALPTLTGDLERASQSDIPSLNGLSSRNARFYEHRTKKVPLVEMNGSLARQELTGPPSFAQSQFETIIRRQRNSPHGLKIIDIPPRVFRTSTMNGNLLYVSLLNLQTHSSYTILKGMGVNPIP
jgi:hypothetical protein